MASTNNAPFYIATSFLLVTCASAASFFHNPFVNPFVSPFSTLTGGAPAPTHHVPAPARAPILSPSTPILGNVVSHISTAPAHAPSPAYMPDGNIAQFIMSNMIAMREKTELFTSMIESHLKSSTVSPINKECLRQCQLVYQKASESTIKCISHLNANKMEDVEKEISAVAVNVDTCSQCTNDPIFQKFGEWVKGTTNDCLAKIQKYNS